MVTVIGVRFRNAGKIYYFDPGDRKINRGASVIVETSRGLEMGTVMLPNKEVEDDTVVQPLKPVIRMANEEDFQVIRENKEKQKEAYKICQEKIAKHELEMKLVDVEYTFDNNKILFYFTANGRIDFRELVKDLASIFKTRIELRQIGVRDETKLLGGVGICGRALCCHTYLADFIPVSIKMAKEQNLSLNPTKISGVCGRLMCCLKNEEETYEYLNSKLPNMGDTVVVRGENVAGTVQDINVLRQRVKVMITNVNGDNEVKEYPVEELKLMGKKRRECCMMEEEQNEELNLLEKEETLSSENTRREEKPRRERKPREEQHSEGENNSRQDRGNRGEKKNRENRENRGERGERPARQERSERGEKSERPARQERSERGEKNERSGRQERSERGEKNERSARQDKRDKGEKNERNERSGRQDKRDKGDRRNRGEKNERPARQERPEQAEGGEQNNRQEKKDKGDRRNRGRRDHRRDNRRGEQGNSANANQNPEA